MLQPTSVGSRWRALITVVSIPLLLLILLWATLRLTPLDPISARAEAAGTVVLDVSGEPLQRDRRDGLRISVPLDRVSPQVVGATIATEDQRYYWHLGIDPLAMVRAVLRWREAPSGASTITQQLARRLYLRDSSAPTVVRKLHEAWIALQLERRNSKDEILAAYLNEVYYGRNAYGIEAAAWTYFGVSARDLDLAQAAMLAGLPQRPAELDPVANLAAARERQGYVLDRMAQRGTISRAAATDARSEELTFRDDVDSVVAPHFVQFALAEVAAVRPDLAGRAGLTIETTLEAGTTREAERIARDHVSRLEAHDAHDAAVVVLDPRTGAIVAMVGGVNFGRSATGDVNLALADRQPGSALKPFLYAAALERGYTAASELLDVPTTFQTPTGQYSPFNADSRFRGPVSLRTALASSLNVPAVRMLDAIGVSAFLDETDLAGMASLRASERQGLTLALGGGEVRLLDLTNAYSVFAAAGRRHDPYSVLRIRDATGRVLYEHEPATAEQAMSAEHAFIVAEMLSDPVARQAGFGQTRAFDTAVRTGVKTGTTSGGRDVWAVGFTPERVVGVWVGNADGTPMQEVSSVSGAAPIWRAVIDLTSSAEVATWPEPPEGVVELTVCAPTGLRPGADCPEPTAEWFVRGTEPAGTEQVFVRKDGVLRQDVPPEARAWSTGAGIAPVFREDVGAGSVHVVQPTQGAVLYLAPELDKQEMLVRAGVPAAATRVEFRIDGVYVGTANAERAEIVVPLAVGPHELWVGAHVAGELLSSTVTYEVVKR